MIDLWRQTAQSYIRKLQELIVKINLDDVTAVVERLNDIRTTGGTFYVAGNGGSAATADHWVNDLCKMSKNKETPAIRAFSLCAHTSYLTALGNDDGYEQIFAGQLETYATKGDALIVISASGDSSNLVEAVHYAKGQGMLTVGIVAFSGGRLKNEVDVCIHIETEQGAYQHAEDCHLVLCHLITTCLIAEKGEV